MSDKDDDKEQKNIVSFPSLAERDRMRREKEEEEKRLREEYRKRQKALQESQKVPFFNFGRIGLFTRFILIAMAAVYVITEYAIDPGIRNQIFFEFGFVPAYFSAFMTGASDQVPWSAPLGFITHVFLHSGSMHLLFNMVMLLVFGILVEESYGTARTAKFFFLCSAIGALFQFILNPFADQVLVGASTGVSGLFGAALLMLYDMGRMGPMGQRGPWPMVIIWVVIMVVVGLLTPGNIAWQAHLGGFLCGVGLYRLISQRRIKL